MDPLVFVALWAFAAVLSAGSVSRSIDEETRAFSAILGGLVWFVFAFSALDITVDAASGVTESYQSLFWMGAALAGLMFLVGVWKALSTFRET